MKRRSNCELPKRGSGCQPPSIGARLQVPRLSEGRFSRTKLTVVAFSLVAVCCATAALTEPAAGIWKRARPAVVTLFSVDPRFSQPAYQGSGFLISKDGILVTARHVAEAEAELFAVTAEGQRRRVTGFYGEDIDYDIAVLRLEGEDWPHLVLAQQPLPRTNQWVAVVSPELDAGALCSTGEVRTIPGLDNLWEVIATTIPMRPGQSGSPLLDASGAVVGVVSAVDGTQRGSAMPAKVVAEILHRKGAAGPVPFENRPVSHFQASLVMDKEFRAALDDLERNDWHRGQRRFKKLARRFPDSPLALLMFGVASLKCQAWKPADAALAKVVRKRPNSGLAWYLYGVICATRGRYPESDAALKRSIQLGFPDKDQLLSAWKLMALTNARRKNATAVDEAISHLERLDPDEAKKCAQQLRRAFPKLRLRAPAG